MKKPSQKRKLSIEEVIKLIKDFDGSEDNETETAHIADDLIAKLPLPNVYYDVGTQAYFIPKESDEGWVKVSRQAAQNYLVSVGFNSQRKKNELQSEVELTLVRILREHYVEYAGQIAGFKIGWYVMNGNRILVTASPTFVLPKPGEFPLITKVLNNLLGPEQLPYLYGWTKIALDMYQSAKWQPGQALALCGPKNAGKSLFGDILKVLFGGRVSHPYTYMIGRTQFNNDLISNELLVIDDAAESTDYRSRRHFGAEIKKMTVTQDQRCERKFADAIMLKPLRRLIILLNDDPERMQVLPALDDDINDKIILLKVATAPMPMPTRTPSEYAAFWSALQSELPMFVHFLQQWTIDPELQSDRFGVREYHDYTLAVALQEFSPEKHLLTMIDEQIFDGHEPFWAGSSRELELLLKDEKRPSSVEARRQLAYPNTCGIYLARLERQFPDRISGRTVNGTKRWTIKHHASGDFSVDDPEVKKALATERRQKDHGIYPGRFHH